jgi:hypothetical protein
MATLVGSTSTSRRRLRTIPAPIRRWKFTVVLQ